jgi:hypothetical protein
MDKEDKRLRGVKINKDMTTNKKGAPVKYTKDIFDIIYQDIANGMSLNKTLKQKGMPDKATFYKWLRENEDLSVQYARAKEDRADTYADEIVDIADKEADPHKARVRIEARKWISCKLHPRNYVEKVALEHTGKNGGAIESSVNISITQKEIRDRADEMREVGDD